MLLKYFIVYYLFFKFEKPREKTGKTTNCNFSFEKKFWAFQLKYFAENMILFEIALTLAFLTDIDILHFSRDESESDPIQGKALKVLAYVVLEPIL